MTKTYEVDIAMRNTPYIEKGLYQHWKGGFYWVPGIVALEEETGNFRVLYFSLTKQMWWARPYEDFCELVHSEIIVTSLRGRTETLPSKRQRFRRITGWEYWKWILTGGRWRVMEPETE